MGFLWCRGANAIAAQQADEVPETWVSFDIGSSSHTSRTALLRAISLSPSASLACGRGLSSAMLNDPWTKSHFC